MTFKLLSYFHGFSLEFVYVTCSFYAYAYMYFRLNSAENTT